MSLKLVEQLHPVADIPARLRSIADQLESGELEGDSCTILMGGEIFSLGIADDTHAVTSVLWDLKAAEFRLMAAAHGLAE